MGGWVQVSLGIFLCGKSSQNSSKPVLIFWSTAVVYNVYSVYIVNNYYDLSVLSMSVMGIPKKIWTGGGVSSTVMGQSSFILEFWNFFNFTKPLTT